MPLVQAISPLGRVPVLLVDERPIFESMIINELLEELYPQPALFPEDPLARTEARAWIVFCNDAVMPAGAKALLAMAGGQGGEALARALPALREPLGRLDAELGRRGGPFFLGPRFGLVDAAYAPFLRRWKAAEEWGIPGTGLLAAFPRLRAYAGAVLAHPSVAAADPGDVGARTRRFYAERAAASA